ncbi:MAG TPA: DUF2497 domain-containing protein [Acetobacteraceae bacterium]|nr:DUF2497 domain-containing protein [Acetobacteraceae bacterium]
MSATPNPEPTTGEDPSMEDILASIRRILSEEEPPPEDTSSRVASEDVLVLDSSMMIDDPQPAARQPPPQPPTTPAAASLVAPEAAAAAASSVGALLRTLTDRAVQVHSGGPTLEDVVRAELRPLLKDWLDANLPHLVERLVRAEIERVVGRSVP